MIDLHSHILFGVDDGPPDLGGSLAFAQASVANGTERIVATPHVNSRYQLGEAELDAIPERVADLNDELSARGVPLAVEAGAEVALSRLRTLSPERMRSLCLGDGPNMLVESPYARSIPMLDDVLFGVRSQNIGVVLAHPERCPAFASDRGQLERLVSEGALLLVNAGSLAGTFGRTVRGFAYELIRDGMVHAVASDAHDADGRPPDVRSGLDAASQAFPDLTGEIERLTVTAPAAILSGGDVPRAQPLREQRGLRSRLFGR